MIGLGMGVDPPAGVVGNSGKAARWTDNRDASDTHLAEPNVVTSAYAGSKTPTVNRLPRVGLPGLRGVLGTLTRTGIPGVPLGPPKVARMGRGMNVVGAQPKPVRNVQQFVPVAAPDQAPDWYQHLR